MPSRPARFSSKYIWQPRQKAKNAFKKAARKINAAAMATTVSLKSATPMPPRIAKLSPTF